MKKKMKIWIVEIKERCSIGKYYISRKSWDTEDGEYIMPMPTCFRDQGLTCHEHQTIQIKPIKSQKAKEKCNLWLQTCNFEICTGHPGQGWKEFKFQTKCIPTLMIHLLLKSYAKLTPSSKETTTPSEMRDMCVKKQKSPNKKQNILSHMTDAASKNGMP